jgi:uncharacterized membrane protein YfcA
VPIHTLALVVLSGASTGVVGSMLGIGGGAFLVPILTLAMGFPIRSAVAASLLSVIATASATATVNLERGLVNMRLGMALEMATTIGGLCGGLAAATLTARELFLLFGATLAVMGSLMAMRSRRRNVIGDLTVSPGRLGGTLEEEGATYVYRVRRLPVAVVASLVAGAISGLLGVGGGTIKVPILNTFCGIPIRVAAATSAFMIGVTAAASAFIYYGRGDIDLPLTAAVAIGALPGSLAGARLSHAIEARYLKITLGVLLFLVGLQMGLRAL